MKKYNYHPADDHDHDVLDRANLARKHAGLPLLLPFGDVRATLDAAPTLTGVRREVMAAALTGEKPEAWLRASLERVREAQAADELRGAWREHAPKMTTRYVREHRAETTEALAGKFTEALEQLAEAAKGLPEGDRALDMEAIIDAHATRELASAVEALRSMSVLAGAVGFTLSRDLIRELRDSQRLPLVLDVPEVEMERRHARQRDPLNPSAERDGLRALVACAAEHGPDLTLVRVARGDFGQAPTLSLARDRDDLLTRQARVVLVTHADIVLERRAEPPAVVMF